MNIDARSAGLQPRVPVAHNQMTARRATIDDADAIAAIYNEGIEDGIATFETRLRTADDVRKWFGPSFPIVVIEDGGGEVIAFAFDFRVSLARVLCGIAEFSVYVTGSARGRGAGLVGHARINQGGTEGRLLEARLAGLCRRTPPAARC